MKLLYVASEAAPFVKTGGLGDVAGSLPKVLAAGCGCDANAEARNDVRVVLPYYENIMTEYIRKMELLVTFDLQLSWRRQTCRVHRLALDGVTYYFLENSYYFSRGDVYGYFDDGERFAFFSKAVLDMLPLIGFWPDVIHVNDWQSALVPIYLKLIYDGYNEYDRIKTMFTIHNIQYQGRFDAGFLEYVCGISKKHYDSGLLQYGDGINLMKGAIFLSDIVTTVSPTYAEEIKTPEMGNGLDMVLRLCADKLYGIINGVDAAGCGPEHDEKVLVHYDAACVDKKRDNKLRLQTLLGLNRDAGVPLLAVITRLVDHKGMDLVLAKFDDIMNERLQLVVLGKGDWSYEQFFIQAQGRYPGRVSSNILFSPELASNIYAGADIILIPSKSEPCGLTQMMAMRFGTVPVARETGGLKDTVRHFDPVNRTGNGFTFAEYDAGAMLGALKKALYCHGQPEQWAKLVANCMSTPVSWEESAGKYMELYQALG